jgi:hyperosmotically inducible protein
MPNIEPMTKSRWLLFLTVALGGCNVGRDAQDGERAAAADSSRPSARADSAARPAPTPAPESAPTAQDAALASQIETAIKAETALHGAAIAVKVADGVATLSGSTKDPDLRSMAAQIALSVPGVRSVRNELTLSADV